ncbi:MAG: class II aldolase/adducin family protein [Limnochordia bacterium]|nr:class II aldolase/adducin family protein [Limnochordia bacterium]MDD2630073.1 class II aldolase/adducin family protein [Limnochordia bacterium]MDD4519139.1 class II aldolase/adducin family protein [Limnochordia bacterium]
MASEYEIKRQIIDIGKRIYSNGYVAANDGNISVKLNDNEIIATPTGVSKGFMTTDMLVKVDTEGNVISGRMRPSSELKMHLAVYRQRPDVNAVVHAHPPTATAFAVVGIPLKKPIIPEVVISLGWIPIAKYGTPSTDEIPQAISQHLENHDAILLQNHGAITVGVNLENAYFKMETLELYAKISLAARQLGEARVLPSEDVQRLLELRKQMNVPGRHPGCMDCGACSVQDNCAAAAKDENLVDIITRVTQQVLLEEAAKTKG